MKKVLGVSVLGVGLMVGGAALAAEPLTDAQMDKVSAGAAVTATSSSVLTSPGTFAMTSRIQVVNGVVTVSEGNVTYTP